MIGMAEYYIVLNKCEVGPSVEGLLHIYRQTGSIDNIGDGSYKIRNASELDQKSVMAAIELAWETDFPDDCDYCGNQPEDCDCSGDSLPNPEVQGPPSGGPL